ncbi:mitochondrial carrier domain-containing protein [Pilobolus umbonatus]|nr:mitochondrial carrier domain-containing protein [Pilobolus umbonatus]
MDSFYLIAASISGLVARLTTYPLDTIKTRKQTKTENGIIDIEYHEIDHRYRRYRLEWFISLYHGVTISLLFSVPALTVYLSCYEYMKHCLNRTDLELFGKRSVLNQVISGTVAEIAAGLLFTPMEVIKSQLQLEKNQHISEWVLIQKIAAEDSILGFYRGYWLSLMVFLPHSVTYFVIYEQLKSYWTLEEQTMLVYLFCASIASIAAIVISTPLDIIKTRWQVSSEKIVYQIGPLQIAKQMYLYEGGLYAFTKGLFFRVAWGIPHITINMTLFDLLIKMHKNY